MRHLGHFTHGSERPLAIHLPIETRRVRADRVDPHCISPGYHGTARALGQALLSTRGRVGALFLSILPLATGKTLRRCPSETQLLAPRGLASSSHFHLI